MSGGAEARSYDIETILDDGLRMAAQMGAVCLAAPSIIPDGFDGRLIGFRRVGDAASPRRPDDRAGGRRPNGVGCTASYKVSASAASPSPRRCDAPTLYTQSKPGKGPV